MQIEQNYQKAAHYIRSAASQGAQLAVLPEYCLTSWVPQDPGFLELVGQAEPFVRRFRALAKECNISIVPGTIVEQLAGDVGARHLVNMTYFIDNHGEVLGSYQKKNLWHPERPYLTSSAHEPHDVIDTPIGPVGLLVCWDLAFPESFRELIAQGAKIIIIPTFWTLNDCTPEGLRRNARAEALFLDSVLTARAFENTCAVVFANVGGPAARGYAGLSQVTVPFIGPLGRLATSAEGLKIVDLDMAILDEAEQNYRVRADLASSDWHYDYRHGLKPSKL